MAEAVGAFQRGAVDEARRLALEALAAAPNSPALKHLLGLIECRAGRIEQGVSWLGAACEAEPANIPFRVMLVRALVDSGRASEALGVAARPRGRAAAEIPLWHARAEAADAAGRSAIAIEAWRAVCATQPADWRPWINLGRALLAQSRFGEAEEAYGRALAIAPRNVDALHELGLIFERTNRHERLTQLLDEALAGGIARSALAELWAIREYRAGRFEEALEALGVVPDGQRSAHWHRLRTKIADAAGDPAQAFAAATQMNRAVADHDAWRARASDFRRELLATAQAITPQWAERLGAVAAPVRAPPIFLLGFPRSGTTLLDTFLMGHPGIAVVEEQGLLRSVARALEPLEGLPERAPAELDEAHAEYLALLDRAAVAGAVARVDKAPLNMLLAPLIHALFPGAPIIFAQRHPCDAVLSAFTQAFEANLGMASFLDLHDAAQFYDAAMQLWTASSGALPLKVHLVVYEELVRDPEAVLRPLVAFLGLAWDGRMLDHRASASARGTILNTSYDQVTEPLHDRAVGRWRRYEKQMRPVLPVLLPWAERLGYA